jgi:transcriptional regulator
MYIPAHFRFENGAELIAFMKQYSFATMVSVQEGRPVATHIPVVVDDSGERLVLSAHLAAANEQAKHICPGESLIIFSGPHAYISPSSYDKTESVPTWNYIAVHAYGTARIIADEVAKQRLLEKMITTYEPQYLEQWNDLSPKFRTGMMRGIVAFELEVTTLQGQKKLSQNKTDAERARIIDKLDGSPYAA